MNVLLYSGDGTSLDSVRQTFNCLQQHLSPHYVVSPVTAKQLIEEPWAPYTSLLVIPGGADKPYCSQLNGAGNKAIQNYVKKGGRYLGICAGGYYGASTLEFEIGTPLEVSGPRELALYKGTARGTVFKGFDYKSEKGARAAILSLGGGKTFTAYFNGGCLFEGDKDAEVVARYVPPFDIETDESMPAATVFKKYGKGTVVLSGVHFEYELTSADATKRDIPPGLVAELDKSKNARYDFVHHLFKDKFGLKVASNTGTISTIPALTPLYLSSLGGGYEPDVNQFMGDLYYYMDEQTSEYKDKNDTFKFVKAGLAPELAGFGKEIVSAKAGSVSQATGPVESEDPDVKIVNVYDLDETFPRLDETPYFNHEIYYQELRKSIMRENMTHGSHLGAILLYGEVVTSTSTMLERNPVLLRHAPDGLISVSTLQVSGRGRGSNTWVNPIGVMPVSGVVRIKRAQCTESLVFIQYLASLAIIRAVRTFLERDVDIGMRLKWPNDTYLVTAEGNYVKIGGVMVSCNVIGDDYVVVFGSGTNLSNSEPTTSINTRIKELNAGPPIQMERLLARFMTIFDKMLRQFMVSGFSIFSDDYYSVWMHNNAKVTLERYENVTATIKGISLSTGMLVAADENGNQYELQPDGNSFDVLRGLIRRKT